MLNKLKTVQTCRCRYYTTDSWFKPKTTQKRFQPHPEKLKRHQERLEEKQRQLEQSQEIYPRFEETISDTRVNNLNIQMLSRNLYHQVFKNYSQTKLSNDLLESCRRELDKHGMATKESQFLQDVALKLPQLDGANLEEHFLNIGLQQSQPYFNLAENLMGKIPNKPQNWVFREGWLRFHEGKIEPVDFPLEPDLIFDVEVCVPHGKNPILATAASSKAWYSWVSESLINSTTLGAKNYHEKDLIPLESTDFNRNDKLNTPKLVIGHNVSYDRARVKEQYGLNQTGTRFLDTMSLHICISGMTSYQRAMMKSKKESKPLEDEWKAFSSLNNLSDVHKLYCGIELCKDPREIFVTGSLNDIRENFQELMNYCAGDVEATHAIFNKLWPLFKERFPHPVTFAGMLELSTAYLPVNQNWNRYVEECDLTYEELEMEGKMLLGKRADQACQLLHGDKYKDDIWMWDQDWSTRELKIKQNKTKTKKSEETPIKIKPKVTLTEDAEPEDPLDKKFKYLEEQEPRNTLLPGYPNWYRKLAVKPGANDDWTPGPHLISTSMQITPKLLNLTWEGYPLHFIRGLGWGLLVPFSADLDSKQEKQIPIKTLLEKCPILANKDRQDYIPANIRQDVEDNLSRKEFYSKLKQDKTDGAYKGSGIWCNTILDDCIFFFKLPHKNGAASRVGNPLAKDFLNKFSENVLAGDSEIAERVLDIARKLSYWRNNRDRIKEQLIIWLDGNYGAIIPQIVVSGTLTRRAVEATWMTASTPKLDRIGSELRAMVQAPEGYKFVGADVDSQELWIASMIGDANHAKMHGATPFGWMTLSGTKAEGTDMHSVTAKAVGISRDHAKVINYARIYGAGQNFAEQLLKQFNPSISAKEARSKAVKMFDLTKGKRVFQLRPEYLHDLADVPYNKWQAHQVAKMHGKTLDDMFYKPRWVSGTESAMFNSLEDIASQESPITPFLGARLSRALEPLYNPDDKFLPTRVNWVVQSGAVDFLHLMLVCMRWLMGDKARFSLSFHDEVRYLVRDEDKYDAALAMHVTNLLVRSFCAVKLGIYDLPYSVAFFSSVEIDTVLRKESKQDCKTPSNPYGLEKGYMIPNGESLSIYEAITKAKM